MTELTGKSFDDAAGAAGRQPQPAINIVFFGTSKCGFNTYPVSEENRRIYMNYYQDSPNICGQARTRDGKSQYLCVFYKNEQGRRLWTTAHNIVDGRGGGFFGISIEIEGYELAEFGPEQRKFFNGLTNSMLDEREVLSRVEGSNLIGLVPYALSDSGAYLDRVSQKIRDWILQDCRLKSIAQPAPESGPGREPG